MRVQRIVPQEMLLLAVVTIKKARTTIGYDSQVPGSSDKRRQSAVAEAHREHRRRVLSVFTA